MKSEIKKPYTTPELVVYGDVEKITQAGNVGNSDVPAGTPNTGYPPNQGPTAPAVPLS